VSRTLELSGNQIGAKQNNQGCAMEKSQNGSLRFTSSKGRLIEADFTGGQVSSDGGLLLMRETDRRLGLLHAVAQQLEDPRQSGKVVHQTETMLRQRVMGLIAGWEDLNDAQTLRHDPVHQVAGGTDAALASAPTLCRFENEQGRAAAWAVNRVLVEQFIADRKSG